MAKNINHVSHKKSKLKVNGMPQLPSADAIVEGEIAVNFGKGVETLSIKNESGDVVTFSSDHFYTEQKLGSAFTGENSAKTVTDIIENKLDVSAYTEPTEYWVSGTGENAVVLKNSGGVASGNFSVAEGRQSSATSLGSHAEGSASIASGQFSHVEGQASTASGDFSHAEGSGGARATGMGSHAEGSGTHAAGHQSHAEGQGSKAEGQYSHAEGSYTLANNQSEHASGQYNVSNSASTEFGHSGNTLFSVGNGTAIDARHNAFEIRQNGDIYIVNKDGNDVKLQDEIGNITVDQVIDETTSASTNAVATKAVVDKLIEDEQVWTNEFVALSGTVSAHTENTDIHLTATDKDKINLIDTLSGTVTAHTANTEIHVTSADKTTWNAKAEVSDIPSVSGYADAVKYNSTSHYVEFYHNGIGGTKVFEYDASPFIIDGMIQNVEIKDVTISGSSVPCLVVSFNTDAGKQDINIPLSEIFDSNLYYKKTETSGATELSTAFNGKVDNSVYSAFSGSVTSAITDLSGQSETIATALVELNDRKLDKGDLGEISEGFADINKQSETIAAALVELNNNKLNTDSVVTAIMPSNSGSTAPVSVKVVANINQVIADAFAQQQAEINALRSMLTDISSRINISARLVDSEEYYKVGVPTILYCSGVPNASNVPSNWNSDTMGEWTGVPRFIGQMYIDTSSSPKLYVAKQLTNSTGDWFQV